MRRDEKIDLSILDPSLRDVHWESRVREVAEQAQLLRRQRERGEQLEQLRSEQALEQKVQEVILAVHGSQTSVPLGSVRLQSQVTEVGPRALLVSAVLAAATWLGVLWIEPQRGQEAAVAESPGLNLATWAAEGRVPRTKEILHVMEIAHVER